MFSPQLSQAVSDINNADALYQQASADRDAAKAALASVLASSSASTYGVFTPTVFAALQKRTDWSRGADVAGLVGAIQYVHNVDGSTTFAVTPQANTGGAFYNNFYNFVNLESGVRDAVKCKYVQITDFEVPDDTINVAQQIETNFDHTLDNNQYNGGVSVLLGQDRMKDPVTGLPTSTSKSHVWRWFDITPGRSGWYELPEIPFDITMFGTGKRIRIVSEYQRVANTVTHVAVTINGTRYAINRTSKMKPEPTWGPHIQHGFQLDTRNVGTPFSVVLHDAECRIL